MNLGVSWPMLAAAAAGFGAGAVWYTILGKLWLKALGKTRDDFKPSLAPWLVSVTANLLIAFVLGNLMGALGISGWIFSLIFAFMLWAGFTISIVALDNTFAGRPVALTLIDGGHALLNICVQGLVLGLLGTSSY